MSTEPRAALWPLSYGMISVEPRPAIHCSCRRTRQLSVAAWAERRPAPTFSSTSRRWIAPRADFAHAGELARGERSPASGDSTTSRARPMRSTRSATWPAPAATSSGAGELLDRSLALRQEIGDRRGTGITLDCLAVLLARSGDPAARPRLGRAGPRLVHRERRPDRPQRRPSSASRPWRSAPRTGPPPALIWRPRAAIFGEVESMHQAGLGACRARRDARRGGRGGGRARLARAGDAAVRAAGWRRWHCLLRGLEAKACKVAAKRRAVASLHIVETRSQPIS